MSRPRSLQVTRSTPYICRTCRSKLPPKHHFFDDQHLGQRRWISKNYIRKVQVAENEWLERAQEIKDGKKKSILDVLEERGYINQMVGTREELNKLLNYRRVGVYAGVDPTAPSMHVGHMVPFMALSWMYIHGYSAYFVLGGFTSRIGDPTGRLKGREAQERSTQKSNMAAMHMQLKRFGVTLERYAERKGYTKEWAWKRALINNATWWSNTTVMEFMRLLGSGMRLGPMLGRDTVKNRMEKGDGMSYAEFSYPLIQAWDWWKLYQNGVQIQIGGADQFGNILAGAEAVKHISKADHTWQIEIERERKVSKDQELGVTEDPLGFTVPLLTTSSGEKFGKSAGNAVWLDKDMTSVFDLYQFFLRSADADVEKYLKLLTFLPLTEISEIMAEHSQDESKRVAQHRLAKEFVELVHGLEAAEDAETQHRKLFGKSLTLKDIQNAVQIPVQEHPTTVPKDSHPMLNKHAQPLRMEDNTSTQVTLPRSLVYDQPLSRVLWHSGLVASRSEGHRLINNGGVYVGAKSDGKGTMDEALSFTPAIEPGREYLSNYIIEQDLLILRVGKWKMKIIKIVPDAEFEAAGMSCPGWQTENEDPNPFDKIDLRREQSIKESHEKLQAQKSASTRQSPYGRVIDVKWK